jgi:signal transduction histidine kinase
MMQSVIARGMFYWLRSPKIADDMRLQEMTLIVARLCLSVYCLASLQLLDSRASSLIGKRLLCSYIIFSLLIFLMLRKRPSLSPFIYIMVHLVDIVLTVSLIVMVNWPEMSFILFFFVLIGTIFRWGFWETQLTNFAFGLFLLIGCLAYNRDLFQSWHLHTSLKLIPEILLLAIASILVGLIAEAKAVYSENSGLMRIIGNLRSESELKDVFHIVIREGMKVFGATQVMIAMREKNCSKASLYCMANGHPVPESCELDSLHQGQYFFPAPAMSWRLAVVPRRGSVRFKCMALDDGKLSKSTKANCDQLAAFSTTHPFRTLLATAFDIGTKWEVRVFVIDPMFFIAGAAGLRFLDSGARQADSVIRDLFLVERLKIKAKMLVQGQVARELHDGAIQTLSNINLQLEDLQKKVSDPVFKDGNNALFSIQQSIQAEIVALRDFMQGLRMLKVDSSCLLDYFSSLAMRFRCEHGIDAQFVSEVEQVRLQSRVCIELARIAQEALVNVRKHSCATRVLMRFSRRNGDGVLTVIDNGKGFGFSGRRQHEDLRVSGKGPVVIMERARAINGKISIESIEGQGSWLEVVFPYQ